MKKLTLFISTLGLFSMLAIAPMTNVTAESQLLPRGVTECPSPNHHPQFKQHQGHKSKHNQEERREHGRGHGHKRHTTNKHYQRQTHCYRLQ